MTRSLVMTLMPEGSGEAGLHELQAFYRKYRSKFVKERDPELLLATIADRKMFVLRNEAEALRGTCGSFAHGDGRFREEGGVRILDEGFGLQADLMSAAIVSEWIFDWPNERLYAATDFDNIPSIKNIGRAGFTEVRDLGAGRMAALKVTSLDPKKKYFLLPPGGLEMARARIRALLAKGFVEKNGIRINIDIQLPLTAYAAFI